MVAKPYRHLFTVIMTQANWKKAKLHGANFRGARLDRADLRDAKELTQQQLDEACGDGHTKLREGLTIKPCTQDKRDKKKEMRREEMRGLRPVARFSPYQCGISSILREYATVFKKQNT